MITKREEANNNWKVTYNHRYKVKADDIAMLCGNLLSVKTDEMINDLVNNSYPKKETLYDYCAKRNMFL